MPESAEFPEFFIPYIPDPAKAEELWRAVKNANEAGWAPFTDYRIFRIEYVHGGESMDAQVGEPHAFGHPLTFDYDPDYDDPKAGEFVVAIFEKAGGPYVVCTNNRGVVSGGPILVGLEEARRVIYFDGYGPGDRGA
jgi:hypothetical protein